MGASQVRTDFQNFSYKGFSQCFKGKIEKSGNNRKIKYSRQFEAKQQKIVKEFEILQFFFLL